MGQHPPAAAEGRRRRMRAGLCAAGQDRAWVSARPDIPRTPRPPRPDERRVLSARAQLNLILRNSGTSWGIFLAIARPCLRALGARNPLDTINTDPVIKIQFLARIAIQYDIADLAAILAVPTIVSLFVWRDGLFTLQARLYSHLTTSRRMHRYSHLYQLAALPLVTPPPADPTRCSQPHFEGAALHSLVVLQRLARPTLPGFALFAHTRCRTPAGPRSTPLESTSPRCVRARARAQDSGIVVTKCELGNMWVRFLILLVIKPLCSCAHRRPRAAWDHVMPRLTT
eukprot:959877-Prymnesium_polylepis.1